jgi:beta-galactosidase
MKTRSILHPLSLCPLLGLACAALPASSAAAADSPVRERINFNSGWRFQKDDPSGAGDALGYSKIKEWLLPSGNAFRTTPAVRPEGTPPGEDAAYAQPGFNDSDWRRLNLPHDWGIEGPFRQDLPGETGKLPWFGVAWYRKAFDVPAADRGRQIFLNVDGAMSYAAVWCNGKFVGGWPYGYASWQLDLTPFLKFGGGNVIAIRLDNPPESSRWYPGGGIYRNVWLEKTSPVHVAQWGSFISATEAGETSAKLALKTLIANKTGTDAVVGVRTHIVPLDKNGAMMRAAMVSFPSASVKVPAGGQQAIETGQTLGNPNLWSIGHPNRYVAITTLEQDGKVVDRCETPFGIRTIEFTKDNGFLLNGKRVPLNGVCQHHDLGALGAAISTRALERQLEILKEMGCNAIRTSHNPPAPELLDLCDRMGFVVMDEFVDCWKIGKKPNGYNLLFADWSEADVRSFVRRDRNHPSVILWSIGNEIPEQGKPEGPAMGRELSRIVHDEDPTRPTTIGANDTRAGYNGFQAGIDVFGYNYKPWEYKKFREANPDQPLLGSETASCISSRGEYFFPVSNKKGEGKSDFQMSSYDLYAPGWATTPDTEFKGQDENPFVAGEFVWTGFDYLGEPTPYNDDSTNLLNYHSPEAKAAAEKELKELGKIRVPSRSSYFGIIDLAGFPKDRFYLYQARWRPDFPMAHILPHWNWAGREGEVTPVHVYTSGDEAELFLNGKSLGKKKRGQFEYRLRWDDVKFEPGELKVVAYKNGKGWAKAAVKTSGPAAKLALKADRETLRADGDDLAFVTVTVTNKDGVFVPDAKPRLRFAVTGPAEIVAADNGDPTDHTVFSSPERKAFNGLALVIVRAKPGAAGPIVVRAEGGGLAKGEVTLRGVSR